jgi:hypothetical protein
LALVIICTGLSQLTVPQKPRPQTTLLLLPFIVLFQILFVGDPTQLIAFLASGVFALHLLEDEGDVAFAAGDLGPVSFVAALEVEVSICDKEGKRGGERTLQQFQVVKSILRYGYWCGLPRLCVNITVDVNFQGLFLLGWE